MSLRTALCQINTIPGDIPGNRLAMERALKEAQAQSAELVVFPEMALVGYCPRDLLFRERFVEAAEEALLGLADEHRDLDMLVGTVRRNRGPGKPFFNCAAWLSDGRVRAYCDKVHLPDYDVFDEARYFEPGGEVRPLNIRGHLVGVTVCEDIWVEPQDEEAPRYVRDPAKELVSAGADLIINLSASPYHQNKPDFRAGLVSRTARRLNRPTALANLWGGNDEILFDGCSVAADPNGRFIASAPAFGDAVEVVDLCHALETDVAWKDLSDIEELRQALVMGIQDYAAKTGFQTAVMGLSGGIDSAVCANLVVDALGSKALTGVAMPSPFSSEGSVTDAADLAKSLDISFHIAPIEKTYLEALAMSLGVVGEGPFGVMEENIQARIRGLLLMAISNRTGALLITTGNKSELAVGYCTLYGDMCGGLAAISDVYKQDVYALGRYYESIERLPSSTITKPPSAELRPNQTDQDSLPPYDILDQILKLHVDRNCGARTVLKSVSGTDEATIDRVLRLVAMSEYKRRQAAPGLRVSSKAFGFGRRVPIVANPLGFLRSS